MKIDKDEKKDVKDVKEVLAKEVPQKEVKDPETQAFDGLF
jgi:hypothetical protein